MIKMSYLNFALYLWHYRKGYLKVLSYPKEYNVDKDDLEILFFIVLRSKNRRVESFFSNVRIKDKEYYWYYFGAFSKDPALLIMETDIENPIPILISLAVNLKLSKFKNILPIDERFLPQIFDDICKSEIDTLSLVLTNKSISNILNILIDAKKMRLSMLLKRTEGLEPCPALVDLMEVTFLLLYNDLIKLEIDKRSFDRIIKLEKVILPIKYIDTNYVRRLRKKTKKLFPIYLEEIKDSILKDIKDFNYSENISKNALVNLVRDFREVVRDIHNKVVLDKKTVGDKLGTIGQLINLGVIGEIDNKIFLKFIPILEILDMEKNVSRFISPINMSFEI